MREPSEARTVTPCARERASPRPRSGRPGEYFKKKLRRNEQHVTIKITQNKKVRSTMIKRQVKGRKQGAKRKLVQDLGTKYLGTIPV